MLQNEQVVYTGMVKVKHLIEVVSEVRRRLAAVRLAKDVQRNVLLSVNNDKIVCNNCFHNSANSNCCNYELSVGLSVSPIYLRDIKQQWTQPC